MQSLCAKCQGRKMLCGLPRCPILDRIKAVKASLFKIREREIFGATPPAAVVGEAGWPLVRVYIGEPPEVSGDRARDFDDPARLWGKSLEEIIELRSYMAFGYISPRSAGDLGEVALVAVSERPVDVEMKLAKEPSALLKFDLRERPMGPRAPVDSIRVADNPRVPRQLERLIQDDVKASEGVRELYLKGVDIYTIQRAFALGLLGARHRRRLVPTRWSITAVDVAVGDVIAERVRRLPEVSEALYGYGEYLDNRYLVIVVPGPLKFSYLERWMRGDSAVEIRVDEDVFGRRSTMDGGYEAARLAVLEKLATMGRRGTVAVVRRIGEGYYVSVGNWQIRETIRRIQLRPLDEEYVKFVRLVGRDPLSLVRRSVRLDNFFK